MKNVNFYFFGAVTILFISCQLEAVDPTDYADPGEIKPNEIVLSSNTVSLDQEDSENILAVFEDRIVVSKSAKFLKQLSPGKIIFKNNLVGVDSVALYRRVVEIRERPNNFLILTKHAGLAETFYKYNMDTRSDQFSVQSRTYFFEEFLEFKTPYGDITKNINFEPQIDMGIRSDGFVFTSSFDSSQVVNGIVAPPSFHFLMENVRAEVSGKFLLEGHASISIDTTIKEATFITRFPEFGMALYYEVSLGISGSLEGKIESPIEAFTYGGYDLRFDYDYQNGNQYSIGPSQIQPSPASSQEWVIETDGNVEIRLGVDFFISIYGAPDLAKLGVNMSGYFNPGIHHSGDLTNPSPGYNLNFEAGIVGNVFMEALFYDVVNLNFTGPDIKYPLISGYTVIPFCPAFDNIQFMYNSSSQDFDLRVDNSDPSRQFYKVFVNGNQISHMGNPTFDYNKEYTVQIPISSLPVNEVIIQDFFGVGCYVKGNFVNPNGFGNCQDVVFDREGNDYCTTLIGENYWMTENLRLSSAGEPVKAEGSPEDRLYGRLYTFDEILDGHSPGDYVQGLCPDGWHIPSQDDWDDLIYALGGSEIAGLNMKYPSNAVWDGPIPDAGTFNAIPSGEYYSWQGLHGFENKKAFYWSSHVGPLGEIYYYSVSSHIADVIEDFAVGKLNHSIKEIGYSCRCVRNQ